MGRAEKLYKPERDNRRGYCEWIPDAFTGDFIERLLHKMLIPAGDEGFKLRPLNVKETDLHMKIDKYYEDKKKK
jgi:hypothetical protein